MRQDFVKKRILLAVYVFFTVGKKKIRPRIYILPHQRCVTT